MQQILEKLSWRIPREIRPTLYELQLHPDLKTKKFSGKVAIHLNIDKPISFIPIHSKYLTINKTELFFKENLNDNNSMKIVNISSTFDYPKFEYWVTELNELLQIGEYVLKLQFNGSLTDRIVGFYESSYFDKSTKQTRCIATSKFEPTFARQAYPCFDEPNMKAQFQIDLIRPTNDDYISLSNMDELNSEEIPGTENTIVHFNKSVPMSTYLSCFIVSDFKFKEQKVNTNGNGTDFMLRVFGQKAQLHKVDYALKIGTKITEHYIQYFQVPYPLPKLDMVAIPDFVSGAMEHWGLVTFRETALLFDEISSSTMNKQRVAHVVAHELAHMWFGNLVTMLWWDELWLNEGFASYIEYKGINAVLPEWNILDTFPKDEIQNVMELDATLATHPIVQTVKNPDEITSIFDSITYSKGASVLRMLEDFVGPQIFQNGVSNYLKKFKYGNAVTNDLLNEIEQLTVPALDVTHIVSTWTKQAGFPVINVEQTGPDCYRLTQCRFFSNPKISPDSNSRWYIPITYKTNKSSRKLVWFKDDDKELLINENSSWIKFNVDQYGYYCVNYPTDMWKTLTNALKNNLNDFSVTDRANLINDAFILADSTKLEYNIVFGLVEYLNQEKDYVPWMVASKKLIKLLAILSKTDVNDKYQKFIHKLLNKIFQEINWNVSDNFVENQLRSTILNLACTIEIPECKNEINREFNNWLLNVEKRPTPDLRQLVYYFGMKFNGNENNWQQMWQVYLTESDAQEKVKLMYGLTAIDDPKILRKLIDLAWDEKNVRRQDYLICLQQIAENRIGENIVWDYFRENWLNLVERFGLNERQLGRVVPSITKNFNSNDKLKEVNDFFEKYPNAGAGASARSETIEQIKARIEWQQNNLNIIQKWLNENIN